VWQSNVVSTQTVRELSFEPSWRAALRRCREFALLLPFNAAPRDRRPRQGQISELPAQNGRLGDPALPVRHGAIAVIF
jgi:hypothetical protein